MPGFLVGDVIRSAAHRVPGRPAVTHRGRTLSYAEVGDQAQHIARALAARGLSRGDRVVWRADTAVEAVPLYFGLAQLGAVFVPVNPRFSDAEVTAVIGRADPALVLTDHAHDGDLTIDEILSVRPANGGDPAAVEDDDPHVIFFTSGTTGRPKGVVLSHRTDMIRASLKGANTWPLGATVCMFPQFHMAGWLDPLSAWMRGEEVVYVDGGDPDALLGAVEAHRAYRLYCIPAVWRRVIEAGPTRFDHSSLRQADTGTSAITLELLKHIRQAFPQATTTVTYGSTEAGVVSQLWPDDVLRKPGSVGRPGPNTFLRIEAGELLVRNPWLMSGYFRDPEASADAMAGGWYHTGELADIDEEGYCHIIGRVKDIIRTAGETVSPAEVEEVIQSHPAVLDAAVGGARDDDWGEIVTAFVVRRPGETLDLDSLRAYCAGKLAGYKQPRRLVDVESIPRTPTTGQVQRRLLLEGEHSTEGTRT
jgi:acyl-CoA synthetase (AMP-forming)/AMP-acid ligase II